ncbi:MAG: radical SAM protein [Anaerolineae bacterium]|nr:radical SAM protein [Anaerolineae bacterium]
MTVDLLLVNPLFLQRDPVEHELMTPYFPLGLLYLASTARQAGYSVQIFDCMFRRSADEFARALDEIQPRVVGFGILSTVRAMADELIAVALSKGYPILVGGADPTARPESYLAEAQWTVIAVVGEAEETLLELLPALLDRPGAKSLGDIAGIAYRDQSGEIVHTGPRPLHKSVDALPFPARDLIDVEAYRRAWRSKHESFSLSVIASRGCPYGCAWCQKSVFGRSFRLRSSENVADETLEVKEKYHPDMLRIVDDVTGIDRDWVRRWRDALIERGAVIPFECLSRVDLVDREMLTWLKEAGCVRISFGAESGSQKVLDAMTKGTRVEQLYRAAGLCHELGIELYFFIMVGYPSEGWADILATAKMLRETMPDTFSSTIAYPLQGTPFYEQVKDRLIQDHDWAHTAENRVLYRGEYSTRFYRWVQRWFRHEWRWARIRTGWEQAGIVTCVRVWMSRFVSKYIVYILRYAPPDARAVPVSAPGH